MVKSLRRFSLVIGAAVILALLVAVMVSPTAAAPLTGGNTTYLIGGEEVAITFDPVSRKDGLLLPVEVFERFKITVQDSTTRTPTVRRGDVSVRVSLGSTAVAIGTATKTISPAPLRLNGRIFLAADLLKEFGIEYNQDGAYLTLRDLADALDVSPASNFAAAKASQTFTAIIKSDTGSTMLDSEFTLLTPEIVSNVEFSKDFGLRVRLLRMLETNTLLLVRIRNEFSTRAVGWQAAGLYLVDDLRNQYDFTGQVVEVQGDVTTRFAPTAEKVSVMVYPKTAPGFQKVTVYFDPNAASIGSFNR